MKGQRDRYMQRCKELKDSLDKAGEERRQLADEKDRLQTDNVAMYEKISYLHAYGAQRPPHVSLAVSSEGDEESRATEARYRPQYEETLNPFRQFHNKEMRRGYREMHPGDRATFQLAKVILTNAAARLCFAGYTLTLHLLVFFISYKVRVARSSWLT